MTTTINASTSAGLVQTADTSGVLALQTANTTAVTIDANQRAAFVAGTAALPAITTTGDTNTGIFFPAADTIGFAEGGAEVMRIDSSGNVGIGTTSPATKLEVASPAATPVVLRLASNKTGTGSGDKGRLDFYSADNSGTAYQLGYMDVDRSDGTGTASYISFANRVSGTVAERMRIDSDGFLLYNTTSTTVASASTANTGGINFRTSGASGNGVIDIARTGDFPLNLNRLSTTGGVVNIRYNGTTTGTISTDGTNTTYGTSSDYRLKENIAPMTGALAKVSQLKPVTYTWKVDGSDGQGFIAHELAEIVPDCVTGKKDATRQEEYEVTPAVKDGEGNITTPAVVGTRTVPSYQGIDTSFLVATLTAAIQELKAINDTQAETITTLAARITALEGN